MTVKVSHPTHWQKTNIQPKQKNTKRTNGQVFLLFKKDKNSFTCTALSFWRLHPSVSAECSTLFHTNTLYSHSHSNIHTCTTLSDFSPHHWQDLVPKSLGFRDKFLCYTHLQREAKKECFSSAAYLIISTQYPFVQTAEHLRCFLRGANPCIGERAGAPCLCGIVVKRCEIGLGCQVGPSWPSF